MESTAMSLELCVWPQKFCNMEFHEMDIAFHTSSPTMFISETLYNMLWHILHLYLCQTF